MREGTRTQDPFCYHSLGPYPIFPRSHTYTYSQDSLFISYGPYSRHPRPIVGVGPRCLVPDFSESAASIRINSNKLSRFRLSKTKTVSSPIQRYRTLYSTWPLRTSNVPPPAHCPPPTPSCSETLSRLTMTSPPSVRDWDVDQANGWSITIASRMMYSL